MVFPSHSRQAGSTGRSAVGYRAGVAVVAVLGVLDVVGGRVELRFRVFQKGDDTVEEGDDVVPALRHGGLEGLGVVEVTGRDREAVQPRQDRVDAGLQAADLVAHLPDLRGARGAVVCHDRCPFVLVSSSCGRRLPGAALWPRPTGAGSGTRPGSGPLL